MILYLFNLAIKRIKSRAGIYMFLALEFTLALAFVILGINQDYSYNLEREAIKASINSKYIELSPYVSRTNNTKKFDMDKLESVLSKYEDDYDILICQLGGLSIYSNGSFSHKRIISLNDKFFKEITGFEMDKDKVYFPKGILGPSAKVEILQEYKYRGGKLFDKLELLERENEDKILYFTEGENAKVKLSDAVLCPLFRGEDQVLNNDDLSSPLIFLKAKKGYNFNLINQICNDLGENFPNFVFSSRNILSNFIRGTMELSQVLRIMVLIANFILISIFSGLLGSMFIMISNRINDYRIEMLVGAKPMMIALSCFLEYFIVLMFSSLAAFLISLILKVRFETVYFSLKIAPKSIFFIIAIPIFLSLIAGLFVFNTLRKEEVK